MTVQPRVLDFSGLAEGKGDFLDCHITDKSRNSYMVNEL